MTLRRSLMISMTAAGLAATVAPRTAAATTTPPASDPPMLALFGSGLGSGSAVGPDGALYVTDGNAGSVLRIDRETGDVTTFADGLPPQVLGIGGAIDVAFVDDAAYVLVTMVGGDIVDGDHIGDAIVGIYRVEDDGSTTVIADLGGWSVAHPPTTDFFITTGVQYALETVDGGLLVTDGHHNRVLRVELGGEISEIVALENVVPTGLEASGDTVFVGEAGPLPHRPEDGRVVELLSGSSAPTEVAGGASMIVDVELGPGDQLYALSQGEWDEVQEGSPASPDTGRLVEVGSDGTMTPVVDDSGAEIVLDRPTSLEFVEGTAYVVTLAGEVLEISDVVPTY